MATHEQRKIRRKSMALAVKSGSLMGETAEMYDVSVHTVRDACKENGVNIPFVNRTSNKETHRVPLTHFQIVADLQNTVLTYQEIGAKYGVSRERVRQIREYAIASKIKMNRRKSK